MRGYLLPIGVLDVLDDAAIDIAVPAQFERNVLTGGVVLQQVRSSDINDHRCEVRGMQQSSHPLDVAQIGASPRDDPPVAPRLSCDPLNRVEPVFRFVAVRDELPARVAPAAHVHPHEVVALRGVGERGLSGFERIFVVRGARKQSRRRRSRRAGKIYVGRKRRAVTHRHLHIPFNCHGVPPSPKRLNRTLRSYVSAARTCRGCAVAFKVGSCGPCLAS